MNHTNKLLLSTLALSACLIGQGSAQADRYRVSIGGGRSALPSKSIDSLTSETSYGRLDAEVSMKLLALPMVGDVEVGLSLDSGSTNGVSFGRIHSVLSLDTVLAVARIHHDLRPSLRSFAEAGMGIQWSTLSLEDSASYSSRSLQDSDKALASRLGIGIEYSIPRFIRGLQVGLEAKVNYRVVTSLRFEATPMSQGGDELLLPTSSASLGSINTSGVAFSTGLVARF